MGGGGDSVTTGDVERGAHPARAACYGGESTGGITLEPELQWSRENRDYWQVMTRSRSKSHEMGSWELFCQYFRYLPPSAASQLHRNSVPMNRP